MSFALAGGFLSTGPPEKSSLHYGNHLSGFPAPTLSNPQSQSLSIFHPVSGIILSKLNAGQVALSFKSLHWISVSVQFSRTVMSNSL